VASQRYERKFSILGRHTPADLGSDRLYKDRGGNRVGGWKEKPKEPGHSLIPENLKTEGTANFRVGDWASLRLVENARCKLFAQLLRCVTENLKNHFS